MSGFWSERPLGNGYHITGLDGRQIAVAYGEATNPKSAKDRAMILAAPDIIIALIAASHALKSYAYGNSSPDLALEISIKVDAAIALASGATA